MILAQKKKTKFYHMSLSHHDKMVSKQTHLLYWTLNGVCYKLTLKTHNFCLDFESPLFKGVGNMNNVLYKVLCGCIFLQEEEHLAKIAKGRMYSYIKK